MRSRILAICLAAAAATLVPAPASADTLEVLDGAGDYWHDHRADGGTPDQHPPDFGKPDLRRTVYRHWHDRVSVRFKIPGLDSSGFGYRELEIQLKTNEGLKRTATWFKPFDGPASTEWSGPGSCAIKGSVDFAADAIVVEVPRSCLSRPNTVRFKSLSRFWPTSDDVAYLDVSGQSGFKTTKWSKPVAR